MNDLQAEIHAFLSRPGYLPMRRRELARAMGVSGDDYALFREALNELERQGIVTAGRGRRYTGKRCQEPFVRSTLRAVPANGSWHRFPAGEGHIRGRIEVKDGRYGFLVPSEPGVADLFVPGKFLGGAMDGDIVLALAVPGRSGRQDGRAARPGRGARTRRGQVGSTTSSGRRGPVGRVTKIVERGSARVTGVFLSVGSGGGIVLPDSRGISEVSVRGETQGASVPANDGQKVSVEITRYPQRGLPAEGRVVKILGEAGTWEAERAARMEELGLSPDFPEEVEREAAQFPAELPAEEIARRADYSNEIAVTIDPDDARDYDDAISVAREPQEGPVGRVLRSSGRRGKGGWRLRVHIADVAQYVRPGTPLDREARRRGTSVYIPGEVFRMLPDRLSADICSLVEGEVRPTRTVTMRFDGEGRLKSAALERSVIRSRRRLTYEQVLRALEGESVPEIAGEVLAMLHEARELHERLRDLRRREGSLDFSFPETRVVFGRHGRVVGVTREVQDFSHCIIEEFMLAANRAVAELLAERALPGIFRIHEDPKEESLHDFARLCRQFGVVLKPPYSGRKLSRAVAEAHEQGSGEAVALALLRSLKLARYYERSLPHYALAFDRYCHFTSPIRRYPDLWMHRLLGALFEPGRPGIERKGGREGEGGRIEAATGLARAELAAETAHLAEHCSIRERAAERAERKLTRFRQLEFLCERAAERPDDVIEAVVRDLDDRGLTVEVEGFWVRARVPVANLPGDGYRYGARRRTLAAKRGRSFRVGDRVKVRVDEVDLVAMEVIASVVAG